MSKKRANALCLIVAAIWGGGFIATDAALDTFDPFTVLMIRFAGAALVCWIVCFIKKVKITKDTWKRAIVSGILLYLAFAFQTFGLDLTNTGNNAFLTAVNVVLVPYISWGLFHKKPLKIQVMASFICLVGIGCLSFSTGKFSFSFGDLLSLICAFFFACHIISLEYATEKEDSRAVNAIQMTIAAILSVPFALGLESWPQYVSSVGWMSCLYMIVIATWLAFQLQTLAQKYTDASSVSVLLCTESLFANVFGYFILHEEKTSIMILGGLLIFFSVVLEESGDFFKKFVNKDVSTLEKELE